MDRTVVVVPTGTANLASVLAGLRRAGAQPRLADDPEEVAGAAAVVLPGVGALSAAMERLREGGFVDVLRRRITLGQATLAVCLGLQLLGAESEESPGVSAIGAFSGTATRFPSAVRVPQMGWNQLTPTAACRFLKPGYAYFANSYRFTALPTGWEGAWSDHGGPFVAALERGLVVACQFHPELSGEWGQTLLSDWVEAATTGGESC